MNIVSIRSNGRQRSVNVRALTENSTAPTIKLAMNQDSLQFAVRSVKGKIKIRERVKRKFN